MVPRCIASQKDDQHEIERHCREPKIAALVPLRTVPS